MAQNSGVLGSNPGEVRYLSSGCAYAVLQTVQRSGVCSAVYGTVHYKKPLKSFNKTRAFLPSPYCHDCAESDVKQYLLTHLPKHISEKVNVNFRLNVVVF